MKVNEVKELKEFLEDKEGNINGKDDSPLTIPMNFEVAYNMTVQEVANYASELVQTKAKLNVVVQSYQVLLKHTKELEEKLEKMIGAENIN